MNAFRLAVTSLVAAASLTVAAAESMYPAVERAKADIESAVKEAKKAGKRVIVDFGGNWCTDCKILDINLKKPENAALLDKHFVMVHVNVGDKGITDNFDVADRFGVPLKKGVPALAVLDGEGRVVYAQKNGEFESMRKIDPKSVGDFLNQWRQR
ncbi:MAG TPA: thioredoxin family protein [Usitatibacter sp.]|nr:thioredoxin family protein [Usitatibacter sp.]